MGMVTPKTHLFQLGEFTLHSGEKANFKIECDALETQDWFTLAHMIAERAPPFHYVVGVPTGGLVLAHQLEMFRLDPAKVEQGHVLVVDDVYTTGASIKEWMETTKEHPMVMVSGFVVFARKPIPKEENIQALFTMGEEK